MSLSTHVLDTVRGIPAKGVEVQLWEVNSDDDRMLINESRTNSDGRVPSLFINDNEIRQGNYEIVFFVGNYFKLKGDDVSNPPFLNEVPIRFAISDVNSHYHVPLLISPWSYSTYRGS